MSLFSALHVGQSGISTSQNALNTTAHNLSNIETQGYTRQQVLQSDRVYHNIGTAAVSTQQSGLGVAYSKVRQVRDEFLDASYRKESGREAFYSTCYEVSNEMEVFLGELTGASFKDALTSLWTSVEELQKDPSSAVTEGQFVSCASEFLDRAQGVYQGLVDYQDNLNAKIKDMVTTINEYCDKICEYNDKIGRVEMTPEYNENTKKLDLALEEANDLRDARNQLLDELGAYGNVTYKEDIKGMVTVTFEGIPIVVPGKGQPFYMGTTLDPGTGFYTPVWPSYGNKEVFDVNQEISSKMNTNIGELKSLVLARGDRRANYTDLEKDVYQTGTTDKMCTSNSIIMNAMAEFDNLVHKIVTEVNNILAGEKKTIDEGGTPSYTVGAGQTADDVLPMELFVRLGSDRYKDDGSGTYTYVPEDTSGSPADVSTMYTCSNLKINPDLLKQPTKLGHPQESFITDDKEVDQSKADQLANAFSQASLVLNPNVTKTSNFSDLYSDMVSAVGTSGYIYKTIADSQSATVTSIDNARQQIMGVSSNEELQNMIKFQNAFNAASRYINTVNDMIAHVIDRLGNM
ncbi:MAG: flagellar hook-associated protein FlgK [Lachnospiraceae bacterium]|nr:flagellar hook-associated protein FlgK [Lachnospiraceae bacterium]